MSHSNNDRNKIFTWKKIQTYLKIERRGKDAHELEKAASEDPFLSDAIEGYESSKNDPIHNSRLKEIEDYVRYRKSQEKGESDNTKRIIAIAASVTVLLSASLWIWFSITDINKQYQLGDVPQIEKAEESEASDKSLNQKQDTVELNLKEKSQGEYEAKESIEPISPEPNMVSETNEEEVLSTEDITPSDQESTSGQAYTVDEKSSIGEKPDEEVNLDALIARIVEMERAFLEQKNLNSLVKNEPQEEIFTDMAPASREVSNVDEEELQKRKSKKTRNAAGAASQAKPENVDAAKQSDAEMSLMDSQIQKDLELKTDSSEGKSKSKLILAIEKLYSQDTTEAINQLKTVIPRSDSQKVLLDSLIQKLSR